MFRLFYRSVIALTLMGLFPFLLTAQTDSTYYFGKDLGLKAPRLLPDSAFALPEHGFHVKKRPFRAGAEVFLINAGVWSFDRFALNEEFAHISLNSIRDNIKRGFVWDNDQFSTNLFAHPYHGGLYFNAARSNGLNFWESIPYAAAGSLMWEFAGEIEPAAINDFIATTIGGVAIGEVTNRISLMVIDESEKGAARVGREVLAFIASPIRGLNRLINGDMWRVKSSRFKYHDFQRLPVRLEVGLGSRYLADDRHFFRGEHTPFLSLGLIYGDPFRAELSKPYDYFTFNATMNLGSNQPIISEINLTGKLLSTNIDMSKQMDMVVGLYQHFNYYDSEPVLDGDTRVPFKISEAAALGPGAIFRFQPATPNGTHIEQRIFTNATILGGSLTDYYNVIDRNYNMGSGFSLHSHTHIGLGQRASMNLTAQHFRIFTWKGYDAATLSTSNPLYLNAQGDKGNASLTVLKVRMNVALTRALDLGLDTQYYLRHTHYSEHPSVRYRTFETRLGLYCHF